MAKLSANYASAIFKLSVERGAAGEMYEQALFICDVLKDADCRRILVHPHISNAEKLSFFNDIFEGRVRGDLTAFLRLVIDKNRESHFLPAVRDLIGLIERFQGKTKANVLSAADLDEPQSAALKEILSKKLDKQVEIFVKVDPSLIGGPYINVDGYIIDRTIKNKLFDLTAVMNAGWGT